MSQALSVSAAAVLGGAVLLSAPAVADDLDTFAIDVILSDLEDASSMDEFEARLQRAASDYCEENAPMANHGALQDCEDAIMSAVEEAIEDHAAFQHLTVAFNHTHR